MRLALRLGIAAVVAAALAGTGVLAASASPYKFARSPVLPPVSDVTGLDAARLVAAQPVALPGAAADGTARFTVLSGGYDRTYLLAPARRVAARARPAVLLVLPAANTNLRTEYDRYGLDAFRDHGLTVVVAGTEAASWNAGSCCGTPQRDGVDDVAALVAMRADAVRRSGADPARTAVVGHSVGGLMAFRLACTPSFGAAAVVAVSGTLVAPCSSLARTPDVLVLHGDQDRTVPIDGSRTVSPLLGIAPPSVRGSVQRLASAGGCGATTTRQDGGTVVTDRAGCTGGGSLRFQVVQGAGHPWDGLSTTRRLAAFLDETVSGVR